MSKLLRRRFPAVTDSEWLKNLKIGDECLYCYGGSAKNHPSSKAKVVKVKPTFLEIQVDGHTHTTRLAVDGMERFFDANYFMYISPLVD